MLEYEKEVTTNISGNLIHRISSYFSFSLRNPNKTIEFTGVLYYQPDILQFTDYRLSLQSAIAFKTSEHFYLTANFNGSFDSTPPLMYSRLFYLNTYGCKITI
ncbi:MAG: hypothetical protein ACK5D8_11270 [Bacteroidota bacterium]